MKFIRDINQVGRRERLAAGIVSTVVGGALITAQDVSEGGTLEGSIIRVGIATALGISVCIVYSKMQRRKMKLQKSNELKEAE